MDIAAQLRQEAQATNERRMLVLTGSPEKTRQRAREVIRTAEIPERETVYIGPNDPSDSQTDRFSDSTQITAHPTTQYRTLLGSTWQAAILDCHDRFEPNVIGGVTGMVAGGGLLVLLLPAFDEWMERRDSFDETLAVSPYSVDDVGSNFRTRLIETLEAHRGIAIVDADTGVVKKEGLTNPAPRRLAPATESPGHHLFPESAYMACLTNDQQETLSALEALQTDETAVVVEADRGRGKSSVAGIASASLALSGADILVTAPERSQVEVLFEMAAEYLESHTDAFPNAATDDFSKIDTALIDSGITLPNGGRIRYVRPQAAAELPDGPDCVIVDEAAGIPVRTLSSLLSCDRLAFLTTVHGYEGTGRSFAVRFRNQLAVSRHTVTDVSLSEPVRYAPADPLEAWSFRALCLHGRPPVAQAIEESTTDTVEYRQLSSTELREDEQLLQEVFGLLVLAHYHTEPNDLARLLDAPNVSVHALLYQGHPVSVALLAREGAVSDAVCAAMYEGRRVRGNLIPDLLASQLRDESAPKQCGNRVLRIATHEAVRSQGLGSLLLSKIRKRAESDESIDWLGVSFGATPQLISFWQQNGLCTVHFSTSRNERSGEHSAVMLDPVSEAGKRLLTRHTNWFLRRFPSTLTDSLSTIEPDIVRAVCRATARQSDLSLSPFEWQILSGLGNGAAIFETAPRPIRQLTLHYLTDPQFVDSEPDGRPVSSQSERLLVMKAGQTRSWDEVCDALGHHSQSETMRALGEAVDSLVVEYGDQIIQTDRERLRE